MSWSALRGNIATQGRFGGKYELQDARVIAKLAADTAVFDEARVEYSGDEDADDTSAEGTMTETDNDVNCQEESAPQSQPIEDLEAQGTDQTSQSKESTDQKYLEAPCKLEP